MKKQGIALILLLALLIIVTPASAHGYIVRAIPENRAVLDRAPNRLQYWFSEALEQDFSEINVRDQNGNIIATGGVAEDDNALMSVHLPSDMRDGAYIVELRPAFASDGHVVAESRVFFIGEEIGGVAGAAANNQAEPLEVVWRVMILASTMLLFGVSVLYANVLLPAWGNNKYRAGLLPPRVMKRLNVIMGYALLVAFLGNGLALIQQTMTFFSIGFVQALDQNFWSLVRIGSRFGDVWNMRMFLLGIVGLMYLASLYFQESQPQTVRGFWTANVWVLALVIGSFSVVSHAAGSLVLPWVGIPIDWLHGLAVGFWAGGLAALVLVLPVALRPYEGDGRRQALLAALRQFSPIAMASVAVVITTGIYSASNWIYGTDEVRTTFGGALLIKILLVLALLGVGAAHHITLNPQRYTQFSTVIQRVGGFISTLRLEAVFALAVIGGASLLSATPVPVPDFAQQEVKAPTAVQTIDDLTIVLTLLPGGPGVNTFDTTITRNGQRVGGLDVQLQKVHPSDDRRGDWQPVEAAEDGLYVTASGDIDEPGRWWTLMDVTQPNGETTRVAFDWNITNEAAVIESVQPSIFSLVALFGVLLAVAFAIYPLFRRFVTILNLDILSVSVAILATVATIIVLIVGFVVVQNTRNDYDETLNPPPVVINSVLPTQASINRGERLFMESCEGWQDNPDFRSMIVRLSRTHDDELYLSVENGWRDLPACESDLSTFQRWDVVNYLRTLREDI